MEVGTYPEAIELIKARLTELGTKLKPSGFSPGLTEYESGPTCSKFIERTDMGYFSLELVRVPKEYLVTTVDIEKLKEDLAKLKVGYGN